MTAEPTGANRNGSESVAIRRITADDDPHALTALLHRAYSALAAQGMRYVASHQDVDTTRTRLGEGEGYVAVAGGGRLIGTVVLVPPNASTDGGCAYYTRPGVAWFQQFAVDPDWQGRGVGGMLMDAIERRACELGASEIALDTSEQAEHLIALYTRRGYAIVGAMDWSETNYRSVVMCRLL